MNTDKHRAWRQVGKSKIKNQNVKGKITDKNTKKGVRRGKGWVHRQNVLGRFS
jgi:hypothetical protein